MANHMTTRDEQERNVPIHNNNQNGDMRSLISHFWNMLDFPHSSDMADMEPKIEVSENQNEVTVTAEMPGVAENDIDVEISSDGYLTISGEKRHEHEENSKGSYFSEISYGMVKRTIPLPWDLQFDNADAEYADGVLKIAIPKSPNEQKKKKKINISRSNSGSSQKSGRNNRRQSRMDEADEE